MYLDDGSLMLDRRVIGLADTGQDGGDLAIRIEVDGDLRYLDKAKYEGAKEAGVIWDWKGGAFYIDAVKPSRQANR